MSGRIIAYFKKYDWVLFFSVLLLVSFGLTEIYSISLGQGELSLLNFKKQIFFVALGLVLLFSFSFLNYHHLRVFSVHFYVGGLIMLAAVLLFGETIRGTKGWFYIFGFGLQPVELIKFILILFLSKYFSEISLKSNPLKHLLITGGGTFLFILLVLAQPDFGSAAILFFIWLFMIVVAGLDKKYLLIIFLVVSMTAAVGWFSYLQPYQKQRVMTFVNPSFDPLNQGYNVAQAIIAVGAGGLTGRGIGFGSQSQLRFLPESQNDFIFAVIAEELGFLGVIFVLAFFAVFFYRSVASIKKIGNDFGIFFILGATGLIFIEMFINIGMNIGILPVVGISLPFLSYGGSAMLSNLIIVGVIESILIRVK